MSDAGLAHFKGMPLTMLCDFNTGITDLTPLQGMPLEDIRLTPKNITRGLDILRDMKSLKTIGIDVQHVGRRRSSGSATTRGSSRNRATADPAGWPGPTVRLLAVLSALIVSVMQDVTAILNAIEEGDPQAAAQLLPLVYDELRKLAAARMADEAPGNTLNATALVHEAYLRLVGRGRRSARLGQPRPLLRGRRGSHAPHPGGRRPP